MLGHVYVVDDAKDLAQIVRDVSRYGGAYRPEVGRPLLIFSTFISTLHRISTSLFRGGRIGKRSKKPWIKPCTI
jgi:recyclin-1